MKALGTHHLVLTCRPMYTLPASASGFLCRAETERNQAAADAELSEARSSAQQSREQSLAAVQEQHAAALGSLRQQHETQVAQLQANLQQAQTEGQKWVAAADDRLCEVQAAHAEAVQGLQDAVASLQEEVSRHPA